jgi:hypothetical protein
MATESTEEHANNTGKTNIFPWSSVVILLGVGLTKHHSIMDHYRVNISSA